MQHILSDYSSSITELKRNPHVLLDKAQGNPVAILNHNKPIAYLIPADTYEAILDLLEEKKLVEIAVSRANEYSKAIDVKLNDL